MLSFFHFFEKHLDEHNKRYVPSYCFNWSDPHEVAGHKQSGAIGSPNNFENHKEASTDYAKRPIEKLSQEDVYKVYDKYIWYIIEHIEEFPNDLVIKFLKS